jgi:Stage II sporulation protein E (SpoIIE)
VRRILGPLSAITLVVLITLTMVGAWVTRVEVHNQETRLLTERGRQVSLVLTTEITAVTDQLNVLAGVLSATNDSKIAFLRSSVETVVQSNGRQTVAILEKTSRGFVVLIASGSALQRGQLITDQRVAAFKRALTSSKVVPTSVVGSGKGRVLGFALGPPKAPQGLVLYLQNRLGRVGPPLLASSNPFTELHVAVYASQTATPSQVVSATAPLPLRGGVRTLHFPVGARTWTLEVTAAHPLVGGTVAAAPWIALGVGLGVGVLLTLVVEIEARRRRSAVTAYRSEHHLAEALQRSLLPTLPTVDGLELAARYLPGSADQEVGGDWYDVFELDDGRVGITIGDVVGHDISAATMMSRVQTALRAYAFLGEEPSAVLDRLDRLISTFGSERLVTVFYGVLSTADPAGNRTLLFANAGHPSPLTYHPDAGVGELQSETSLLLGVAIPTSEPRSQHEVTLPAGSTLVLFTDGLVEVPGQSLTDQLGHLRDVAAAGARDARPEQMCDWLLERMVPEHLRDDVAVLVARLTSPPSVPTAPDGRARVTAT